MEAQHEYRLDAIERMLAFTRDEREKIKNLVASD
jgi:hypothetical protein